MTVEIEVVNAVISRIIQGKQFILPALEYYDEVWIQGQFRKRQKRTKCHALEGNRKNDILTGFVPRIVEFCKNKGELIQITAQGTDITHLYMDRTTKMIENNLLPNITLRPDQCNLLAQAITYERGVILSPTASGKTIIMAALCSHWIRQGITSILILIHTTTLVTQTAKVLVNFGMPVSQLRSGIFYDINNIITVATHQTYIKYTLDFQYDAVIIDETHHISDMQKGQYNTILRSLLTDRRIAFTATLPTKPKAQLALEGLVGPVIGEFTLDAAITQGIVAQPHIKIIKTPYSHEVRELNGYPNVYEQGIIKNRSRNKLIIKEAKDQILLGNTVLILVTSIPHGEELLHIANLMGVQTVFLHGETDPDERELKRQQLIDRSLSIVIASNIWAEGVNIPNLNVVINAAGGRSELVTLQKIGRGLRVSEGKVGVLIVDFFDPSHKYLIDHFGHRVSIYCDNGWL